MILQYTLAKFYKSFDEGKYKFDHEWTVANISTLIDTIYPERYQFLTEGEIVHCKKIKY